MINTSSKLRGKARVRANGNMTPATGVESPTRTRELPRSTIREQAGKLRSPGSPTGEKMARVQAGLQRNRQAHDREELIVADRQVPRPWIVADSRVPSVALKKAVMRKWRVVAGRQAGKACPPSPPREVEVVEEPAVAVAVVPAEAVVAVAAVAAAEDDREVRI